MSSKKMQKKWRGFGWNTEIVDGHNISEIYKKLKKFKKKLGPNCLIIKTQKGNGVSFMENNNDWHHGRLTKELYNRFLKENKIR